MSEKTPEYKLKEETFCIAIAAILFILFCLPLDSKFTKLILSFAAKYVLLLKIILIIWIFNIIKLAFFIFKQYLLIKDTPISKLNSAAQGYITTEGIISGFPGKPLLSPISQVPCVWYYFTVEEKQPNYKFIWFMEIYSDKWEILKEATSEQEFILTAAKGKCFIDPEDADILTNINNVWYSNDLYEEKNFHNILNDKKNKKHGKYKYTEELLLPQQTLYVSGFFRSINSPFKAQQTDLQHQEILDLLKNWKKDYQKLLEKFDANKDGSIDAAEWEQAVKLAEKEINSKYAFNDSGLDHDIINIISNKGLLLEQPFIISIENKLALAKKLNIKFFYYMTFLIIAFTLLLSMDYWYIDTINLIKHTK